MANFFENVFYIIHTLCFTLNILTQCDRNWGPKKYLKICFVFNFALLTTGSSNSPSVCTFFKSCKGCCYVALWHSYEISHIFEINRNLVFFEKKQCLQVIHYLILIHRLLMIVAGYLLMCVKIFWKWLGLDSSHIYWSRYNILQYRVACTICGDNSEKRRKKVCKTFLLLLLITNHPSNLSSWGSIEHRLRTHTLFWPQKVILLFDMLMITSVPLLHFWGWKIVHTHMCGTYNVLAMYTYTYVSMLYMCISIRIPLGHSFWCCLENNGVYTSILCKSRSYMYGMDVGNSGW